MARPTGVTVWNIAVPEYEKDPFEGNFAFGYNPHTFAMYVIHNPEGVAWESGADKAVRFRFDNYFAKWYNAYELLHLVDWDKPMELSTMISTFGDRLGRNFYSMYHLLTDKADTEHDVLYDNKYLMQQFAKTNVDFQNIWADNYVE